MFLDPRQSSSGRVLAPRLRAPLSPTISVKETGALLFYFVENRSGGSLVPEVLQQLPLLLLEHPAAARAEDLADRSRAARRGGPDANDSRNDNLKTSKVSTLQQCSTKF